MIVICDAMALDFVAFVKAEGARLNFPLVS